MNLRKEVRAANLKKWKATSPALVMSPLKFLHDKFSDIKTVKGESEEHPAYTIARRRAQKGKGQAVQRMARAHA